MTSAEQTSSTDRSAPSTSTTVPVASGSGSGCATCHHDGAHAPGTPERRTVLRGGAVAAAAGAGAVVLSGCTEQLKEKEAARSHYVGSEPTDVLAADELPVGASRAVEVEGRTLLLHRRDQTTVTAFSNVCTHQGCLVQPVERPEGPAYGCPCHGSHFDVGTGEPYGGPAKRPLTDYEAAIEGGRIIVKL